MNEKLIGYLLGALEIEEIKVVEQTLQANEIFRQELEILRMSLLPLEGDRAECDAPRELAARTCHQIRALQRPAS